MSLHRPHQRRRHQKMQPGRRPEYLSVRTRRCPALSSVPHEKECMACPKPLRARSREAQGFSRTSIGSNTAENTRRSLRESHTHLRLRLVIEFRVIIRPSTQNQGTPRSPAQHTRAPPPRQSAARALSPSPPESTSLYENGI